VLAHHPLAFLDPIDLAPPGYSNELSTFHFVYDPVLDVLCSTFADRKFSVGVAGKKKKKQRKAKYADSNGSDDGSGIDNGNSRNSNCNGNDIDVSSGNNSHHDWSADGRRKASVPRELRKRLRRCHPEEIIRKFENELLSFLGGLNVDRKVHAGNSDSACAAATEEEGDNADTSSRHLRNCSDDWVVVHEVNDSDNSHVDCEDAVVVGKENENDLRMSSTSGYRLQENLSRAETPRKPVYLVWEIGECFSRWVVHKMCAYYQLHSFSGYRKRWLNINFVSLE
jgi:hypothetical protein